MNCEPDRIEIIPSEAPSLTDDCGADTDWCEERRRMFIDVARAIKRLLEAQNTRKFALQINDRRPSSIDEDIAAALTGWRSARQAYMQHLRVHGC